MFAFPYERLFTEYGFVFTQFLRSIPEASLFIRCTSILDFCVPGKAACTGKQVRYMSVGQRIVGPLTYLARVSCFRKSYLPDFLIGVEYIAYFTFIKEINAQEIVSFPFYNR